MTKYILCVFLSLPLLCSAQQTTDWNLVREGTTSAGTAQRMLGRSSLVDWANSSAFTLISAVRDGNEAIVTGTVQWPDTATGVFTTDAASLTCPGAINAYHVTYVPLSGPTLTLTQAAVTRDNACAVTAQPPITIN